MSPAVPPRVSPVVPAAASAALPVDRVHRRSPRGVLPLYAAALLILGACSQPAPSTDDAATDAAPAQAAPLTSDIEKGTYGIGQQMGRTVANMPYPDLDQELLIEGLRDALAGRNRLSVEEMQAGLSALAEQARTARSQREAELAAEGRQFLQSNAAREQVTVTDSGLQYEVLEAAGEGPHPGPTDTVVVHYTGKLVDGSVFDSSVERGEPAEFPLNRVIRGWTEGLQLMRAGDKYRFYIPYELGYGERGAGARIPPYSVLVFDVELLEIKG